MTTGAGGRESGTRPGSARAPGEIHRWWWAAVPLLLAFVATARTRLNGDVDYALGTIETADRGGVGVADVFGARPYVYRLFIDGVDRTRRLIDDGPGSGRTDDLVIRVLAAAIVALVGLVLWRALRRHCSATVAAVVALTVSGSLAIAPPWHFLEPDWAAVVLSVLGVGLALLPRRDALGALLGAVPLALAVAVKLATFPWALIGLIAIAVVTRRRAVATAVAWVVAVGVWAGLTRMLQPWEITWLGDQARLVTDSPLRHGLRVADVNRLVRATTNAVLVSPILVATLPAAVALVLGQRGRSRAWVSLALVVAGGLGLASAYGQGEYFQYHFAGLPVVGAAVWALAFGLVPTTRLPLLVAPVAAAGAAAFLMTRSLEWRTSHLTAAIGTQLAIALAATVWVMVLHRRPRRMQHAWLPMAAGVAAASAFVVALLPSSSFAYGSVNAHIGVGWAPDAAERASAYDRLRRTIGPDTRVTYLAYGSILRYFGNPTTCRYPSPQWLQRAATVTDPDVRPFPSYRDSLRCLEDDRGASFLVWQPSWFPMAEAPQEVKDYVARFDCSATGRIQDAPSGLIVCPRRVS